MKFGNEFDTDTGMSYKMKSILRLFMPSSQRERNGDYYEVYF